MKRSICDMCGKSIKSRNEVWLNLFGRRAHASCVAHRQWEDLANMVERAEYPNSTNKYRENYDSIFRKSERTPTQHDRYLHGRWKDV